MRRTLLPLVALAALSTAPFTAQGSLIVIGDNVSSVGSTPTGGGCPSPTYTGATEVPFVSAMCVLASAPSGARGGTIEVLTGTYTINNTIVVTTPGVTIRGSRGARLVAGDCLAGPMIRVLGTGAGFTLEGVSIVDKRSSDCTSAIRVEAERFTLRGCDVALGGSAACGAPCTGSSYGVLIKLPPPQVEGALIPGSLIEGNSFRFTADPDGVVAVRSERGRSLRIVGNEFRGDGQVAGHPIEAAIQLLDDRWTAITGNVFSGFETMLTDPLAHGLIVSTQASDESGHLAIAGNYFEEIKTGAVISLKNNGFSAVTGNVFGRVLRCPLGAIRMQSGLGNSLSSNEFHNVGFDDEKVIWLIEEQTPLVNGNSFTLTSAVVAELVRCEGVYGPTIVSNQFVAHISTTMPCAIRLANTGAGTVTKKAFVCANAFRSPQSGTAGFSAQWCDDSAQGVTDCRLNSNPIFTP